MRTAPLTTGRDGSERLRDESNTYFARCRDGEGVVVEVATGCRDESAAKQVLADLERRAERVRSGLLSPAESRTAVHLTTVIGEHVAAFIASLEASGASPKHVSETRRILSHVLTGCEFRALADLDRSAVEHWLNRRRNEKASPRTRDADLAAPTTFGNWCVANGRVLLNPFRGIAKANEAADPRRRRRTMTEAELVLLLHAARRRPLLDALAVRRGKRKGEGYANVRPEMRERLDAVGRERALIYETLVLTGLRMNELGSLTVAQAKLDGPVPQFELNAADEKNREGNGVLIRDDLADDVRNWLTDKLGALQATARRRGEPIPVRLPPDNPRLRRAERAGANSRPRPQARRDRQAGRTRPDIRRSRPSDDFRDALGPGRGASADDASRHEAFRPEPHRERLHRPEASGRRGGARRFAQPPPQYRQRRGS